MTWYWLGEQGLSSAAMPTDIGARHFVATPGTVLNLQGSASSIFFPKIYRHPVSIPDWQYPLCFIRYAHFGPRTCMVPRASVCGGNHKTILVLKKKNPHQRLLA